MFIDLFNLSTAQKHNTYCLNDENTGHSVLSEMT